MIPTINFDCTIHLTKNNFTLSSFIILESLTVLMGYFDARYYAIQFSKEFNLINNTFSGLISKFYHEKSLIK